MKFKIIFITGNLHQPRVIKRIQSFYERGFQIKVYGFDRGTFQHANNLPDDIPIVNWGYIENGKNYFDSFLLNRKRITPIIEQYGKEDSILFYVFGFIPTLIFSTHRKCSYIYEISDLIYGYFRYSFLRNIFKAIDLFIIKRSKLTVLTSQGFYEFFYKNTVKNNVVVQPNKLNEFFKDKQRLIEYVKKDSLRFSFIGFLRYPNTIFKFAKLIGEKYPQHSFHFYGDSNIRDKVSLIADQYKNVFFHGKFKNPEDLPAIYSNIDIIVACYDTTTFNERVAEPNKLYESMYFNKPIIVSDNTFLAKQVRKFNCGYAIDASSEENIDLFIKNITIEDINKKMLLINQINTSWIIDSPQNIIDLLNG
ncbi:glycosyltransferase [Parabacteroides sp. Marseille-P3160]|uniref:glycosyltransferase n=1 Tax=Parabacteroides sp. Marseille-P3160 TaxID=1917887 RepID=UPI0009B9D439|nr:glycosyltransferase [Parabacteroides sp. Marseille-P3160]